MKRLVLLPLLWLSSPAIAQVFPWGGGVGGGGGTPDPTRADTAASYTATGPNGVRTVPQANPAALGVCSALAGAWAATTPDYETQVTGYFCNGVRWARVWTDEDGVTVSPDRSVAARTVTSQAANGDYAFKANNRSVWDFGDGTNDELVSLGNSVQFRSSVSLVGGQSLSVDILAPQTAGADLITSLQARWFVLQPGGAPTCTSGRAGGLQSRSSDGNRPWHCDGTAAYRIPRVIPISATLSVPTMAGGAEATLTTTVTGAAVGDHVTVNMGCELAQISVRRFRVSAANTVSIVVGNEDPTTPLPTPTDCPFYGGVYK